MDALTLAQENPSKNVVFLGVGFETTAPGSAIAILEAQKQNIQNFFFLSLLKQTKPAICTLLEQENTQIDGLSLIHISYTSTGITVSTPPYML